MTSKQEKFCDEYILSGGNAAAAARSAGYSLNGANVKGATLKKNPAVKQAIEARLDEIRSEKTVDARELLEFLSSTVRGEILETFITQSGKRFEVKANVASRLKAAEMLCKIYGLFKRGDDEPKTDGAALLMSTLEKIWQKQQAEAG